MAVRSRLEGTSPEGPEATPPHAPGPGAPPGSPPTGPVGSEAGKIDTRYISPNAAAVIIIRPSQLLTAPIAQMLPVELVAAATGFDPTEIEEIDAFAEPPTAGIGYGVTFRFKNPVRASSIPVERRSHVKLAEMGGKKYLRSTNPMLYSLYAPNNRTIICAPDNTLKQLVVTAGQPKSGPMIDRLRDVPSGRDLYAFVDVAPLRPFLGMAMGGDPAKAPPAAKQQMELANQIAAIELTLNISNPGPSSFVVHCTDDAAAQKLETIVQQMKQMPAAPPTEQPGTASAMDQAKARYRDRLLQMFPVQRDGTKFTLFKVEGQNPAQQQFVAAVVVLAGSMAPMARDMAAMRSAAMRQAQSRAGGPGGAPGEPAAPGGAGTPAGPAPPPGSVNPEAPPQQ